MRGFRITVLLLLFGSVAAAVAGIRVEQARCVSRIQQLRLQQLELTRDLHENQLQIARLRSPDQIESRIERLDLRVEAPDRSQSAGGGLSRPSYTSAALWEPRVEAQPR